MNILFMLSRVGIAANDMTGDFAADHPKLQSILNAMSDMGAAFGKVASDLCKASPDVSQSNIVATLEGIGAGLVTFFMVLEIITYCFNVDFHAGFESAMKIGVKTVLMYIIVENCMDGASAVIEVFKLDTNLDFSEAFGSVSEPFQNIMTGVAFSDDFFAKILEPLGYGILLIIMLIAVIILFSMIIVSLIGLVMETTILTVIAPVACATLVNSQVRQTGISALKNLAAISLQWSVISLSFIVYEAVSANINLDGVSDFVDFPVLNGIFTLLPAMLGLAGLAAMISKSGEITRRALGA